MFFALFVYDDFFFHIVLKRQMCEVLIIKNELSQSKPHEAQNACDFYLGPFDFGTVQIMNMWPGERRITQWVTIYANM